MKFRVLFKTPNAAEHVIRNELEQLPIACGDPECGEDGSPGICLDCERADDRARELKEEMEDVVEKFVEYDENITIEFDTEAGTATAIPVKRRT